MDIIANNFADEQAGLAAKFHQVPLNVSSTYIYDYSLVRKIQRRLVDILVSLPHRPRQPKISNPLPFCKESIEELMNKSMHVAFFQGERIACARCFDKLRVKGECTRSWLLHLP